MADYISKFTGEQIDTLLEQVSNLLKSVVGYVSKDDLAFYLKLEDFSKKFDDLLASRGKLLTSNDFTSELKEKLTELYSKLDLDKKLRKDSKYEILTYSLSKEQTRLKVSSDVRKYGLLISYYDGVSHITEKYVGSQFTDLEWKNSSNWINLGTVIIPVKPTMPGVYVLDTDGIYTKWSEWDTTDNINVVGLAVIDNLASFGISITTCVDSVWSTNNAKVGDILTTFDVNVLQSDFGGNENTSTIISAQGSSALAAFNCQNYMTKDGRPGYLPAFGEWSIALNYIDDINKAMAKVGGIPMELYTDFWTSNQCPSGHAWTFRWCHGEHACYDKRTKKSVRAFFKLDKI